MATTAPARVGRVNTGFLAASLLAVSAFVLKPAQAGVWLRTAPRGDALPDDRPPSSFEGREHFLYPFGVADELYEPDKPALLHSNKFYSNMLVSASSTPAWW